MPRVDPLHRPAAARHAQSFALAALLVVTACGAMGAQDQTAVEESSAAIHQRAAGDASLPVQDAGTGGDPASPSGSTDEFRVTIGSGPFAGTHQASGEMNCFAQDGIWGADLTTDRDRGVSNVLVMLTGVTAAGGSTEQVELGLTFGQIDDMSANAGSLGIGAATGGGSGRAVVERTGEEAVIRIQGETPYGAAISAEVRCRSVA